MKVQNHPQECFQMDVQKYLVESDKIFLADMLIEFKDLEGDIDPDERAWVIVRQASQADNIKRADLLRQREEKYGMNDAGQANSYSHVYNDNVLRRRMEEVRLTLKDCGNLTIGDKSLFPKMPAKDISRGDFEAIWGALHPVIADAIHTAALTINKTWAFEGE